MTRRAAAMAGRPPQSPRRVPEASRAQRETLPEKAPASAWRWIADLPPSLLAVSALVGLGAVLVITLSDGAPTKAVAGPRPSAGEVRLERSILALRGARSAREREAALADAPQASAGRQAQLLATLRNAKAASATRLAAIEFIGASQQEEVRGELLALTRDGLVSERVAAVRAAAKLRAFDEGELEELLASDAPQVQAAALATLPPQTELAPEQELALLLSPAVGVRDAAIQAFGPTYPDAVVTGLREALQRNPDRFAAALHALRQPDYVRGLEAEVDLALPKLDERDLLAALDFLATKPSRLADPAMVWSIAMAATNSTEVRARALYCMEQTSSFDLDTLESNAPRLDPTLRYFAARGLLAAQRQSGIELLLDVASGDAVEDPDAVAAARRLLAWLTGTGAESSNEEFRAALESASGWQERPLPPPVIQPWTNP